MNMNLTFSNGINMVLNTVTPGAKGESIESVSLNHDTGMLTVVLTNGVSVDVGNVETIVAAVAAKNAAIAAQQVAEAKATEAQRVLSDLIAMLGNDVATLVDGKLNPSQLPAIAINDTFPVTNTNEMLLLDAQKGDVAIIVANDVVTDSYILATDEPTILANWKKLGVSYVAEAGHALNATNAVDSQQINGHRLVTYGANTFGGAVKDADTLYAVYEGA